MINTFTKIPRLDITTLAARTKMSIISCGVKTKLILSVAIAWILIGTVILYLLLKAGVAKDSNDFETENADLNITAGS